MIGPKVLFGILMMTAVGMVSPSNAAVVCKKKSGAMFVRESCKAKEAPVDLGALGAVGPAGPSGPKGDKGDKGDGGAAGAPGQDGADGVAGLPGPSDGFATSVASTGTIPLGTAAASVAHLDLPAGKYLITAKAGVNGGALFIALCTLTAGTDVDTAGDLAGSAGFVGDPSMLNLAMAHEFATPGRVDLNCNGTPAGGWVQWIRLQAIRVGTLMTVP